MTKYKTLCPRSPSNARRVVCMMVATLLPLVLATPLRAERVVVRVASISGNSVYLDSGRSAGLEVGQRVQLNPTGRPSIIGIVRAVTSNSARVDLTPGVDLPPVGTRGDVDVEGDEVDPNPEHPPWKRKIGPRDEKTPLLAPAFSRRPDERKPTVRGRFHSQFSATQDSGGGRDNSYVDARTGVWIEARNLFGLGGRLEFEGELDLEFDDLGSGSETDIATQIGRLSYAIGGEDYAPYRLEVGRFYSNDLPELGLIDGGEFAVQFQNGFTVGVGAGLYPLAFSDEDWGDDYGFHLFARYEQDSPDDKQYLSAVLGYQRTWHEGSSDRDQILGRINFQVNESWSLFGSMRADVYTGSDTIKGSGIELTELWLQARYSSTPDFGASFSFSHYSWPELLRAEYENLPTELVSEGQVDRMDISGWVKVAKDVRANGRVHFWEDQNGNGHGGDIGIDWNPPKGPSISLSAYYTIGAFNEGLGLRTECRHHFSSVDAFIGYEIYQYDSPQTVVSVESRLRHTVRGGISWDQGSWSHSLTGDYFFGDGEESLSVGLYSTYRF